MKDFSSFYKTVDTKGEGTKCHYPTRMDTYGCGCMHDCSYCYAKSLLSFRGLWDPQHPSVVNFGEFSKVIKKTPKGEVLRLGGMSGLYLDMGTYLKSFYSVMYSPQAVKIAQMGSGHTRIHHHVTWDKCAPKIVGEKYRKGV